MPFGVFCMENVRVILAFVNFVQNEDEYVIISATKGTVGVVAPWVAKGTIGVVSL